LSSLSEYTIHCQIVDLLNAHLPPGCAVHHSPNEGKHKVQYRAKQKRMGVMYGWPDIEVFVPRRYWKSQEDYATIFLEVKTARGRTSRNQQFVHKYLREAGAQVHIVRSIEDVQDVFAQDLWVLGVQQVVSV
tara:strand:- start:367 stop:762 length:396 start_codon:yes stop_codon:yes gene_type:complete